MGEGNRVSSDEVAEWKSNTMRHCVKRNFERLLAEVEMLRAERDTFAHRLNRLDELLEDMGKEVHGE